MGFDAERCGTRSPRPALTTDRHSDAFDQVKSLGIAGSTTATADDALTGHFWNGAIQRQCYTLQTHPLYVVSRCFARVCATVFHSIPLSHLGSFRTYLRWAIADINGNPQSIPPMARGTCRAEPAPPAPPGPSFHPCAKLPRDTSIKNLSEHLVSFGSILKPKKLRRGAPTDRPCFGEPCPGSCRLCGVPFLKRVP